MKAASRASFVLILSVGVCTLVTTASAASASSFDPDLAHALQAALDSSIVADDILGGSAAVILSDEELWLGAAGMSDPVAGDSISTDMLFTVASITKSFMAALTLRLAEEGFLTLDDTVVQWVPHVVSSNIPGETTVRQLLNHTSGIDDYFDHPAIIDSIFAGPGRLWEPEQIILDFVGAPDFPPGADWRYTNTGYLLLGMIIQHSTDAEVSDGLNEYLLDPLALNNTFLPPEETPVGPIAHGWWDIDNDGDLDDLHLIPREALESMFWTAGGIVSSAEDIATWGRTLLSGDVLNPTSMEELLSLVTTGRVFQYGLGVEWECYTRRDTWGHFGRYIGGQSVMKYVPDLDAGLAVLVNNDEPKAGVAEALFEVLRHHVPATVPSADLTVTVRDDGTNTPLANAEIVLDGLSPFRAQRWVSDELGQVFLTSVPEGVYDLRVLHEGYHLMNVSIRVIAGDDQSLTIPIHPAAFHIDFSDPNDPTEWTVTGGAASGHWEIAAAVEDSVSGRVSQLGFDHTHGPDNLCALTGAAPGEDVDTGKTNLFSPSFDLSSLMEPHLFYYRWFFNGNGDTPISDEFVVRMSDDGGASGYPFIVEETAGCFAEDQWEPVVVDLTEFTADFSNVRFRLIARDDSPNGPVEAAIDDFTIFDATLGPIAAPETGNRARLIALSSARPNPFLSLTRVSFTVPDRLPVDLSVFDVRGALVARLLEGEVPGGEYSVDWNGRTRAGRVAAAGVYFVRLETPEGSRTSRIVRLR